MAANDALVLSGGASQGDFEVGAVRRLFELGFQPGLIAATSVGSVNAVKLVESGALAVPGQPSGLEQIWLGLTSNASMYVDNPDFNLQKLEAEGITVLRDDIIALASPIVFPEPGPVGVAEIVQLSILGIDVKKLIDGVQQFLGAKSVYKLDPIREKLNNPNILNTGLVNKSPIKLLLAVVSLETGDLRFVNQHGVLLKDDATTPHLEPGAVPQACQGAADAVSAALANLQDIEGNRNDYTEARFRVASAAAQATLKKAQQDLATCKQQNPQGAQPVVVPIPDAALASASIPFVFEPVKLGIENYVDGGVRQSVPIAGAIAAGATNVWAVLANRIDVSASFTDMLTKKILSTFDGANFLDIAQRVAEDIMPAQIEQDNINLLAAWNRATVTIVQPEPVDTYPPDVHNGFTVDPGLIRIRMAHGYMRADDVNTARELRGNDWATVADQISRLLFTKDIVSLRWQIWLREHDYHGMAPNYTRHGTAQGPTPVAESEAPAEALASIRQMKQQLQQLVQLRRMGINPDGTLIVLDRHLQGAVPDQPVPLTDWWLRWEAHQFPTFGAPWDAHTPFSPLPLPEPVPPLPRNVMLDQVIAFTGTSTATGYQGAYVELSKSMSSFASRGGAIQLGFGDFTFEFPGGPSVMSLDVRFVLDGKRLPATRLERGQRRLDTSVGSLAAGTHTLSLEVRSVLEGGPPVDCRIFGTAMLTAAP